MNVIVFSSDQDWAPPWATEALARLWAEHGVQGTLFVTHACPSLKGLGEHVELAWHPNFAAGSSHGPDPEAVLDHLARIVPGGVGVRSHGLVRSTRLLELYAGRGVLYEGSDLLEGMPGMRPVIAHNGVVRLPIFWEDDVHAMHKRPFELSALDLDAPGLKVFDFHPIHVALNSRTLEGYQALKGWLSTQSRPLWELEPDEVARFRESEGPGTADILGELLAWAGARGPSLTMRQVAQRALETRIEAS